MYDNSGCASDLPLVNNGNSNTRMPKTFGLHRTDRFVSRLKTVEDQGVSCGERGATPPHKFFFLLQYFISLGYLVPMGSDAQED